MTITPRDRAPGETNDAARLQEVYDKATAGDTIAIAGSLLFETGGVTVDWSKGKQVHVDAPDATIRGSAPVVLRYGGAWGLRANLPMVSGHGWLHPNRQAAIEFVNVGNSQISYAVRESRVGVRFTAASGQVIRNNNFRERLSSECLRVYETNIAVGGCAAANVIRGQLNAMNASEATSVAYWAANPTYFHDTCPGMSAGWKLRDVHIEGNGLALYACWISKGKRLWLEPRWLETADAGIMYAHGEAGSALDLHYNGPQRFERHGDIFIIQR